METKHGELPQEVMVKFYAYFIFSLGRFLLGDAHIDAIFLPWGMHKFQPKSHYSQYSASRLPFFFGVTIKCVLLGDLMIILVGTNIVNHEIEAKK